MVKFERGVRKKVPFQELYPNLISKWEDIATQSGVDYAESFVLPTPWIDHQLQGNHGMDALGKSGTNQLSVVLPSPPIVRKRACSQEESSLDVPKAKRRHEEFSNC
jgi:hypothetical protein